MHQQSTRKEEKTLKCTGESRGIGMDLTSLLQDSFPICCLSVSVVHLLHDKHKMVGFTINYRLEQVRFQLQQESKTAGKPPRGGARTKGAKQAP